jgi:hypothetical protein
MESQTEVLMRRLHTVSVYRAIQLFTGQNLGESLKQSFPITQIDPQDSNLDDRKPGTGERVDQARQAGGELALFSRPWFFGSSFLRRHDEPPFLSCCHSAHV